jgi:small-conductance mechanosensitive channel
MINLSSGPLVRPDLRRAAASGGVAVVLLALLAGFGAPQSADLTLKLLSFGGAVAFVVALAISVRTAANEAARVAALRAGPGTASGLRLGLTVVGYLVTGVVALTVLRVPIEKLLLSGAITGVVIGIAAQQALANLFAGLVLLTSRPFQIGESIILRSGALGGEYSGQVIGIGLAYTELLTADGPFSLPNAGVLASAVGPRKAPSQTSPQDAVLLSHR